jgi:DNA/RNA endonuclease YhcR with UshA esterase domain
MLACASVRAEDKATTKPAPIAATDTAAIKAKVGETVTVEGVLEDAEWSNSGKVMNATFKDVKDGVKIAVFQKNKDKINAAFGGDAAAKWKGATVQVTGKVSEYKGKVESLKGRLEIIVDNPEQVTIVEPAK